MNLDEFLKSDLAARRSKISAFDTEIRELRAEGLSGQGIANFLSLKNVQATASAVNQYFVRHPDRYCVSRKAGGARKRTDSADKDLGAGPALTGNERQSVRADERAPSPTVVDAGPTPDTTGGSPLPRASDPVRSPAAPAEGLSVGAETAGQITVDQRGNGSETVNATRRDAAQTASAAPQSSGRPDERSNATSSRYTFEPRQEGTDTYDGNTRPSRLIRYDPNDPKNIAAFASYRQRLKNGEIRTGETTNTNPDRSTDET